MQELESVIQQATLGDTQAFETIVHRFQDMAVGYAYSVVGDFQLAEDAAQEAFVQVHQTLGQLREPVAFPSWFRKVVYKHCDRLTRRKRVLVTDVDINNTESLAADQPSLAELVEIDETQRLVQEAIHALPEKQRRVVTLYYISEYSQKEIATFLDIPITTVKKRLYDAKKRLKQRMTCMTQEYLQKNRPSKDEQFSEKVLHIIEPSKAQHGEAIYGLFEMEAEDPHTFQWRAGRLAHSHVDWSTSRIGTVQDGGDPKKAEKVVTAMHVYDIAMRIGNAQVRTAGFNCEVTHPAYMDQRKDLIQRTVSSALDSLHASGYDLAISFDDEHFWYRQGFVSGWRALQWHVSTHDLPESTATLELHRFSPDHRDDLAQVYNDTHSTLTGTAERPTYLRNKHPEMFMGWYWTDDQGNPAGYVSGGADRYFTMDASLQADLDSASHKGGDISERIRHQFTEAPRWYNDPLSEKAVCSVQQMGSQWKIVDGERTCYIYKEANQLFGVVFDRPLFWVDEVAGDPALCLQALAQLTAQWNCTELFFDRLHYKSGVGKRIRQMPSCRIHTGTFGGGERSYVVRVINLQSLFSKLADELTARLQSSAYADWTGKILVTLSEAGSEDESVLLKIANGQVTISPDLVETTNTIRGGQSIAQLVVGTEDADEIVEMTDIEVIGDVGTLLPILFPAQYPQMENQAL
ncbi:MAG: RNA polymerase sigma factor [Chloroflexota bacterium]